MGGQRSYPTGSFALSDDHPLRLQKKIRDEVFDEKENDSSGEPKRGKLQGKPEHRSLADLFDMPLADNSCDRQIDRRSRSEIFSAGDRGRPAYELSQLFAQR